MRKYQYCPLFIQLMCKNLSFSPLLARSLFLFFSLLLYYYFYMSFIQLIIIAVWSPLSILISSHFGEHFKYLKKNLTLYLDDFSELITLYMMSYWYYCVGEMKRWRGCYFWEENLFQNFSRRAFHSWQICLRHMTIFHAPYVTCIKTSFCISTSTPIISSHMFLELYAIIRWKGFSLTNLVEPQFFWYQKSLHELSFFFSFATSKQLTITVYKNTRQQL